MGLRRIAARICGVAIALVVAVVVFRDESWSPSDPHPGATVSDENIQPSSDGNARDGLPRELNNRLNAAATSEVPRNGTTTPAHDSATTVRTIVFGIIHSGSGEVIPSASVTLCSSDGIESVLTNGDGGYEATLQWSVGSRAPSVLATMPNHQPAERLIDAEKLLLRPDRVRCDFVLEDGIAVFGRIMSRGRAAPGAVATLDCLDGQKVSWADATGRVAIGLRRAEQVANLRVSHGEYGCFSTPVRLGSDAAVDMGTIELCPSAEPMVGRLVYADGQPVTDFQFQCMCAPDSSRVGTSTWSVNTDAGGGFQLHGMVATTGYIKLLGRGINKQMAIGAGRDAIVPGVRLRLQPRVDGEPIDAHEACWEWRTQGAPSLVLLGTPWDRIVDPGSSWSVAIRHLRTGKSASILIAADPPGGRNETIGVVDLR